MTARNEIRRHYIICGKINGGMFPIGAVEAGRQIIIITVHAMNGSVAVGFRILRFLYTTDGYIKAVIFVIDVTRRSP